MLWKIVLLVLLITVIYFLSSIKNQLKLIVKHFDIEDKEIEIVKISNEEIEKELVDELSK